MVAYLVSFLLVAMSPTWLHAAGKSEVRLKAAEIKRLNSLLEMAPDNQFRNRLLERLTDVESRSGCESPLNTGGTVVSLKVAREKSRPLNLEDAQKVAAELIGGSSTNTIYQEDSGLTDGPGMYCASEAHYAAQIVGAQFGASDIEIKGAQTFSPNPRDGTTYRTVIGSLVINTIVPAIDGDCHVQALTVIRNPVSR